MFVVEQAVDQLVCLNIVMGKRFSTGNGSGLQWLGGGAVQVDFARRFLPECWKHRVQTEERRHEHQWVKC
jgi:hypothetical protein